ncbi:DUF3953 domain-containing protein [Halobacillus amylolyticus]|nr:DUF3953 domain-containing protein [Halobacillus amylolyticus]
MILSILVIAISGYTLITGNLKLSPIMTLFLGGLMLVMGLEELNKSRKSFLGYMFVMVCLFLFYVSTQGFLLN